MPAKDRFAYCALIALALGCVGFWGARAIQRPPNIQIVDGKSDASAAQPLMGLVSKDARSEPDDNVKPLEVVVHIVGAVKKPGMYTVPSGTRVNDAIKLAGGAVNADLEAINLAAPLVDGSQLEVPKLGSAAEIAALKASDSPYAGGNRNSTSYARKSGSSSSKGAPAPGSISLNTASKTQLERLPGVGPSTAQKIIDYRMDHGGFSSIEEILQVKGIGPKKFSAMKKYLTL